MQVLLDGKDAEFLAAQRAQYKWLERAQRVKIGLPCDGQSFNDETLEEFLERVESLKATGYHVPDYVAETIREEIAAARPSAEKGA
jgi:hypothetical protein